MYCIYGKKSISLPHNIGERVKYLRNSIFKYLLIVLFMSYYVGGVAFTHVHHFTNYTIIHSHPYLPGPDGQPQHSHSQEALETIELLTTLVMDLIPALTLGMAWLLLAIFVYSHSLHFRLRLIRNYALRGPPAYILS